MPGFSKTCYLLLFIAILASNCSNQDKNTIADTIYINAQFFTADSSNIEALAVKGDKILATGTQADMLKLKGEMTQVIDLEGKFVMPGLIEGHGHFYAFGKSFLEPNLIQTVTYAEAIEIVAKAVTATPRGQWIAGRGWHQEKWKTVLKGSVNGYPRHDDLSAISPDHPIVLSHASGHALLANKKAMELAGITATTKDPTGGRIVRDASGQAIGVFEENAMNLIESAYQKSVKDLDVAERYMRFAEGVKKANEAALSNGITSFQDAGSTLDEIEMYQKLNIEGKLSTRLWLMLLQPQAHEFSAIKSHLSVDTVHHMLTVQAMKAYFDGALGSYGAWLLESYADKAQFFGQNTTPLDTIQVLAALCKAQNIQFCVHAIGDRANREVLNIYAQFLNPKTDNSRWRIEHAQHIDPSDLPRFKQLGVIASMQPIHCTSDQPFVVKRLGEARAKAGAYPWRSLIDSGAAFCCGTDVPVEAIDPFANIYAAVTRKRLDNGASLYPEQSLTRQEALMAYTAWNAYAAKEENQKGSLKPGYLADLVVLDRNLLTCTDLDIPKTQVLRTIIGGKTVYEKR
jgi:predicted amidohydrolase YtcJ